MICNKPMLTPQLSTITTVAVRKETHFLFGDITTADRLFHGLHVKSFKKNGSYFRSKMTMGFQEWGRY